MKVIFCFAFLNLLYLLCPAQESINAKYEVAIKIRNNPTGKLIAATLDLIGTECWDQYHNITSSYQGNTIFTTSNGIDIGWNLCWLVPAQVGLGNYYISVLTDGDLVDNVMLDYRTSDIPSSYTSSADFIFFLNAQNSKLYWDETFQNQVGSSYTIWGRAGIQRITTDLEPFSPNNLMQTALSGNVSLFWSFPEDGYWTGFKIYRDNNLISTVSSATNSFMDPEAELRFNDFSRTYYITAINGSKESQPSNTIEVKSFLILSKEMNTDCFSNDFYLEQNYPNPCNPTTKIKYNIPGLKENIFNVKLDILDLMGNLIYTIIEEKQNAGNYEYVYNGESLSSGIYLYRLCVNFHSVTKKFMVLK